MPEPDLTPFRSEGLPNIFRLADYAVPEDRFTAAWGYLLQREPQVARDVVSIILASRPGLTGTLRGFTNHPTYDLQSKPDFRMDFEEFRLLVEHKLDAPLSETQLERYLALSPEQPPLVAFVASEFRALPDTVLAHERYLRPAKGHHFRWSDFFPAVRARETDLAQQFADYMKSLGMTPYELKGPEDLFNGTGKPEQFSTALKAAAESVFERVPGAVIKRDPSRLGVQIQRALPTVPLFYVVAERFSALLQDVRGPTLSVQVFEANSHTPATLDTLTIHTAAGLTVYRQALTGTSTLSDGTKRCRVVYVVPLSDVLSETGKETRDRISDLLGLVRSDWV